MLTLMREGPWSPRRRAGQSRSAFVGRRSG